MKTEEFAHEDNVELVEDEMGEKQPLYKNVCIKNGNKWMKERN